MKIPPENAAGEEINFCNKRPVGGRFFAILDSDLARSVRLGGGSSALGERGGETTGRSSEGSVAAGAGRNH
jgi:hypothetical protein